MALMDDRAAGSAGRGPINRAALAIARAVRADFGCLIIALAFLLLMALTAIFADFITPPAHNPFV